MCTLSLGHKTTLYSFHIFGGVVKTSFRKSHLVRSWCHLGWSPCNNDKTWHSHKREFVDILIIFKSKKVQNSFHFQTTMPDLAFLTRQLDSWAISVLGCLDFTPQLPLSWVDKSTFCKENLEGIKSFSVEEQTLLCTSIWPPIYRTEEAKCGIWLQLLHHFFYLKRNWY